ncbi:MAG: histidine phosphatase family protein [Alphaproteobacteria bacterium]|nr:histidine phosphatase family protein [Alphaproteobacteria bacterium]
MENTDNQDKSTVERFGRFAQGNESENHKRLIILRHGHPEDLYALKQQVSHAREQLFENCPGMKIDAILYSPIKRTVRTAGEFYRLHIDEESKRMGLILPFQKQEWLTEKAGANLGYDGLLKEIQRLNNDWNTVLLVTHSTTGPHIARALQTDSSDIEIVSSMFELASIMVLDIPADDWAQAGQKPAHLAMTIAQPEERGEKVDFLEQGIETGPEECLGP